MAPIEALNRLGNFNPRSTIPDSVVNLYEFEDDSDTSIAVDTVGSNALSLNGGVSYASDAAVGSLATYYDGVDDEGNSQSTVDLVANGSETAMSIAAWVKNDPNASGGSNPTPVSWMAGNDAAVAIYNPAGTWEAQLRTSGGSVNANSSVSVSDTWQHVVARVTQSEIDIWVDNVQQGSNSHSLDITSIGAGAIKAGNGPWDNPFGGWVDDYATSDQQLTSSDIDLLYNRA